VLSNNEDLIAVIGAPGQQGGAVVRAPQANGQFKVRALTRNPGKHRDLAEEIVEADLDRSKQRRGPWCTASKRAARSKWFLMGTEPGCRMFMFPQVCPLRLTRTHGLEDCSPGSNHVHNDCSRSSSRCQWHRCNVSLLFICEEYLFVGGQRS
jgi:hypothetical protein